MDGLDRAAGAFARCFMANHGHQWLSVAGYPLLAVALAACVGSDGPKTVSQQSFSDPHEYCASVMNADTPAAPYSGAAMPATLLSGIRRAAGLSASAPDPVVAAGSRWRCMDGKVYACFVGANLPCDEKADLSRAPSGAVTQYCAANPTATVVPMSAAGRATVFEWRCRNGVPVIVRQFAKADARGFIAGIWHPVLPAP